MFRRVAQEITQLLADEYEGRPSATHRLAKARLVASLAEGLDRPQLADTGAGLSDSSRAAFLDALLSPEERHLVVSAMLRDPRARAEMSSAAGLLDCMDDEPSPLPPDLLAQAASTFVKSSADHAATARGQRAWRRRAALALVTSLAALTLLGALAPGLLSLAGNETPTPFAEPTGSARLPAHSAMSGSEAGAAGHAVDRTIDLRPETIERARSISAHSESSWLPCDDSHEVAGQDHASNEFDRAKESAARLSEATPEVSCGPQAAATDSHSPKPQLRFDGLNLRATSSRQSNDFRLGTVVDSLYAIPDGLFKIAGRAVSLFGQLGKKTLDLVDPRCVVGQHRILASKSRGKLSSISSHDSKTSLPQACANHFSISFPIAASRVANKDRVQ
jgi:hypothetical protein